MCDNTNICREVDAQVGPGGVSLQWGRGAAGSRQDLSSSGAQMLVAFQD